VFDEERYQRYPAPEKETRVLDGSYLRRGSGVCLDEHLRIAYRIFSGLVPWKAK